MTITIPKPVVFLGAVAGIALLAYVLYEESPPAYRYLFKFEAM